MTAGNRCARSTGLGLVALLLAVMLTAGRAGADTYTLTDLGSLGGVNGSGAYALSGSGISAGYSFVQGQTWVHAMVNDHGAVVDLGTLGGTQSLARDVNAAGDVVGWAYPPGLTVQHAVRWHDGIPLDLGSFGGDFGDAHSINSSGLIVGSASYANGDEHAFWWRDGVMHDMGTLGGTRSRAYGVNDFGDIVGMAFIAQDEAFHPFLSKPGGLLYDLGTLGGDAAQANDVNEQVHVCGWSELQTNSPLSRGFLWTDGVMKSLGTLGGIYSAAQGMNNFDQIVGASTRADETQVAFLWQNDQMVDLNTLLPPGSGWFLRSAWDIDDHGAIVGEGARPDGAARAFLLAPAGTASAPPAAPRVTRLVGVLPNPVRDEARFDFVLAAEGHVSLAVYDVSGRLVRTVVADRFDAGSHSPTWDGRDTAGHALRPGLYWARLDAGGISSTRAFVIAR